MREPICVFFLDREENPTIMTDLYPWDPQQIPMVSFLADRTLSLTSTSSYMYKEKLLLNLSTF